jgi:hypothetical protein
VTENPKVQRPAKRRRRGVTLIEAVLYIAIALALIVGGLVFYQQAAAASRVNSAARSLSFLVAEMRQVVRDTGAGTVYSTTAAETLLLARGSIPADSIDMSRPAGQRIRNPWGGDFALGLTRTGSRALVVLYLNNVPVVACTRLGVADASGTNFWTTNIELGQSNDDVSGGLRRLGPNTTPDAAGIACSGSDVDRDGLVRMTFNLRISD